MELVETVEKFTKKDWDGHVQREGSEIYIVTKKSVHETGEDMGEISRFLV